MEKIRIAVVGAGETGTPLLRTLLDAPFVEVVGVADLDPDMPGMQLAKERGVPTTKDCMDFIRLGDGVDILIDVTGAPKVRNDLRHALQDTANHHTVLMHEMVAHLLMSLSQGKLVDMKHHQVDYD